MTGERMRGGHWPLEAEEAEEETDFAPLNDDAELELEPDPEADAIFRSLLLDAQEE